MKATFVESIVPMRNMEIQDEQLLRWQTEKSQDTFLSDISVNTKEHYETIVEEYDQLCESPRMKVELEENDETTHKDPLEANLPLKLAFDELPI